MTNNGGEVRGGGFGVFGTAASDQVAIGLDGTLYRVSSPGPITSENCSEISVHEVECVAGSGRFIASMRGGKDIVRLRGDARGRVLRGGSGNDVFSGSPERNFIDGDSGDDTLKGRGGDDRLFGDGSKDSLFGGGGNDYLYSRDEHRDDEIDCGAGHDVAVVDKDLDPETRGCEVVKPASR